MHHLAVALVVAVDSRMKARAEAAVEMVYAGDEWVSLAAAAVS